MRKKTRELDSEQRAAVERRSALRRLAEPEDIADAVEFLLTEKAATLQVQISLSMLVARLRATDRAAKILAFASDARLIGRLRKANETASYDERRGSSL